VQRITPSPRGPQPTYDLLLHQRSRPGAAETRTGLRVLVTADARGAASTLRRLVKDPAPPERVVLLTEERQALPLGERGRSLLDRLRARGRGRFCQVEVSAQEFAALLAVPAAGDPATMGAVWQRARAVLDRLLGANADSSSQVLTST
jgi:hypothetical protein